MDLEYINPHNWATQNVQVTKSWSQLYIQLNICWLEMKLVNGMYVLYDSDNYIGNDFDMDCIVQLKSQFLVCDSFINHP